MFEAANLLRLRTEQKNDATKLGAKGLPDQAPLLRYTRTVATFYVENFGCRATQADGASIERQFEQRGLERAETAAHAQVVILNTCTVTAAADHDARAAIRRIRRQNPGCHIVVTGCYAQRAPQEIAALPGVSQVIGNSHKHQLAEITATELQMPDLSPQPQQLGSFVPLTTLLSPATTSQPPIFVSDIFAHTELLAAPVFDAANERTRPNLKIQDGCDNRCAFCVIPYVRGQSRSLPADRVLREVEDLGSAPAIRRWFCLASTSAAGAATWRRKSAPLLSVVLRGLRT